MKNISKSCQWNILSKMEEALSRSTDLWADGIRTILAFIDLRWTNSKTITEQEERTAWLVIGNIQTPSRPWRVYTSFHSELLSRFRTEPCDMLVLFRNRCSTLAIYVPAHSEKHSSNGGMYYGTPVVYYGSQCFVAQSSNPSNAVYKMNLIIRYPQHKDLPFVFLSRSEEVVPFASGLADIVSFYSDGQDLHFTRIDPSHGILDSWSTVWRYDRRCVMEGFVVDSKN